MLDLTGNSLSCTLPTELGLIDHLQYFSFQRNRLEGTLPGGAVRGLLSLQRIELQHNLLYGQLPEAETP